MSTTARLKGELSLDDTQFHAALRRATNGCQKFAKDAEDRLKSITFAGVTAGAAAATAAVVLLGASIKEGLDVGGQFADLSKKIGDLPGQIAIATKAFEAGGLGADDVSGAVGRMQKALVGGSVAFGKLGLDAEKLKAMAPIEALLATGNAIAAIKDPAEQTAVAMELFGKSGASLKQVFGDDGALALAKEALGSMPAILNESGGAIDDLGDRVGMLSTKWQAFSVGITAGLAPVLMPLLDKMIAADTAAFGAGLGKDISDAFTGTTTANAITELSFRFASAMILAAKAIAASLSAELLDALEEPIKRIQNLNPAMKFLAEKSGMLPADGRLGDEARRRSGEAMDQLRSLFPNTFDPDKPTSDAQPTSTAATTMANASPNGAASSGMSSGLNSTGSGSPTAAANNFSRGNRGPLDQWGRSAMDNAARDAASDRVATEWSQVEAGRGLEASMAAQKRIMDSITRQSLQGAIRESNPSSLPSYNRDYFDKYSRNFVDDGHQLNLTPQSGALRSNVEDSNPLSLDPENALLKPSRQVAWKRRHDESQEAFDERVKAAKGGGGGNTGDKGGDPYAKIIADEIKSWGSR